MPLPRFEKRIAGGLWGLLVGDAVGVPYEFQDPLNLPSRDEIEMVPPVGFVRSHAAIPPGTWSDDGAHALALLASLLETGRLDIEDFGRRLVAWYDDGYAAVGDQVFDVGVQTASAIRRLKAGISAHTSGFNDEYANGNGSLMRVLPLALWHRGSDAELVHDAHEQSKVTHGHLRSQVCCALYCLWARRLLNGVADPYGEAVKTLRSVYKGASDASAELEWSVRPDDTPHGTGTGYVVDCLRSARLAIRESSFESVIKAAVALGHDTDTTACVAGGLAGIREGIDAIPSHWMTKMRGKTIVEPLLERLLQVHSG